MFTQTPYSIWNIKIYGHLVIVPRFQHLKQQRQSWHKLQFLWETWWDIPYILIQWESLDVLFEKRFLSLHILVFHGSWMVGRKRWLKILQGLLIIICLSIIILFNVWPVSKILGLMSFREPIRWCNCKGLKIIIKWCITLSSNVNSY